MTSSAKEVERVKSELAMSPFLALTDSHSTEHKAKKKQLEKGKDHGMTAGQPLQGEEGQGASLSLFSVPRQFSEPSSILEFTLKPSVPTNSWSDLGKN